MAATSVNMELTKNTSWNLAIAIVSTLIISLPAHGVEIEGGLTIGATYADNVFLAESPNEIDDVVYQASPFLSLVHESPRFDADLQYTFDWFQYADLDSTSKFHRGEATLTGRAWQDTLEFEVGGERSQVLGDPGNIIAPDRVLLSGNLLDQDQWWVNPRLERNLGRAVTLGLDYRFESILFNDDTTQDNENHTANFILDNYSASQGITWALRYDWRRTVYEFSDPWENQRATAELGLWVNSRARLFASGGKESAWDNPFDPEFSDPLWETGIAYIAGENLSLELAAGERSFGSSVRGNLDYTFRRGSMSILYDQSPTTIGFNRSGGRRGVVGPGDLNDFLDVPGAAERFLSERFEWNLDLEFRRTNIGLIVFNEERKGRMGSNGAVLEDQSQSGFGIDLSWQVGNRTEIVVAGSVVNQEVETGNATTVTGGSLETNYRLGNRSQVSVSYRYSDQNPDDDTQNNFGFESNLVSLFFTITL